MPATFEYTDNYTLGTNEWKPYYHKPFYLGQASASDSGQSNAEYAGDDGVKYVWRDDSVGTAAEGLYAWQDSDVNCGYAYEIIFTNGFTDQFTWKKYKITNGAETASPSVDVSTVRFMVASKITGTDYDWQCNDDAMITIDLGIRLHVRSKTAYEDNHKFWIYTASKETMDKRRIYHGGYATWLRYPANEGDISRTPIIPASLNYKNVTVVVNPGLSKETSSGAGNNYEILHACKSMQDAVHINARMHLFLEWNVNPESDANEALNTLLGFDTSGDANPNVLGRIIANDVNNLGVVDFPVVSTIPYEDTDSSNDTGTNQLYNTEVSAIGGHCRIVVMHCTDVVLANDCELARNQFFPVILFIN